MSLTLCVCLLICHHVCRSKAVGMYASARWGCVRRNHAAGWCICITAVWGLGSHPSWDAAPDLCAHLHWYRGQVSGWARSLYKVWLVYVVEWKFLWCLNHSKHFHKTSYPYLNYRSCSLRNRVILIVFEIQLHMQAARESFLQPHCLH